MKNKTITVDLEAWDALPPTLLSNTTGGIHPGQMMIFTAGRQTGKSSLYMKMLKNKLYGTNLCKEIFLPMHPTPKPKYKFTRAKWYVADLWNSDHIMDEVREWCVEQFGPRVLNPDAWTRWINHMNSTFRFRDEADYVLFMLKWL